MNTLNIFLLSLLLIGLAQSQLTSLDKQYIQTKLLSKQSSTTNLFEDSICSTKDAIAILTLLNLDIPNYPLICKELQYEVMNNITIDLIEIDLMLKCKFDFKDYTLKESDFEGLSLSSFADKLRIAIKLDMKLNWKKIFNQFEKYVVNKKISAQQGTRDFSIVSTAIGIEVYSLFFDKLTESLKQDIKTDLKDIITVLVSTEVELNSDVILYTQEDASAFQVNYQVIKALMSAKDIYQINKYETTLTKMLNYFLRFKYEFHSIENIHILLQVFDLLKWIPIPMIENTKYNYIDDKEVALMFVNAFGNEYKVTNATINYEVKGETKKAKTTKTSKAKNDYDLEDEDTDTKANSKQSSKPMKSKLNLSNQSRIALPLKNLIKSPGEFTLDINIHYHNEKDKVTKQKVKKTITSQSTIKIDHIKLSYEQTENKADEKETTIEYTKRSYRTIKITQDSIIRLKAKLNYGDDQYNKVEQLFLRLKHNELGKTFSSYASRYNEKDGYYYIGFAMNDQMNMESYNGVYELSLIVSDPSMKTPIIWNFAKIEVTFRKPLDPTLATTEVIHKNKQKPKMEPTFTPDQPINKNFFIAVVFSGIILGLCGSMTIYLMKSKANIKNFPKEKTEFMYSLLFAVLLLLVFYVMVLFWVKLNILQTLALLMVLAIPGVIIVYKAMNSIKVDI